MTNQLFTEKFIPKSIKEFVGFNHNAILKYVERVLNGNENKKGVIMWGEAGCGKTTLAFLVAKHFDISYSYSNSSDQRNKKDINADVLRTTSLQSKTILIILDECDGLNKSGFKELERVMKKYEHPFILICNEIDKIPYSIRKICHTEKFSVDRFSLLALANRVVKSEGLDFTRSQIKDIVSHSKSYRDVLHALQFGVSTNPPEQISLDTAVLHSLSAESVDLPTNDLNNLIVRFNDSASRPDLIAMADSWNNRYVNGYTYGKYIVKAILSSIRNPGIKKLEYPRTYKLIHESKHGKMKTEATTGKKLSRAPKIKIIGFK